MIPYWVVPEKIHTKTLEIQAGGGVELEKVFCRGNFDQ